MLARGGPELDRLTVHVVGRSHDDDVDLRVLDELGERAHHGGSGLGSEGLGVLGGEDRPDPPARKGGRDPSELGPEVPGPDDPVARGGHCVDLAISSMRCSGS